MNTNMNNQAALFLFTEDDQSGIEKLAGQSNTSLETSCS